MAFNPILSDQPISTVRNNTNYRNANREAAAQGTPVYFVPPDRGLAQYGYGGPRYTTTTVGGVTTYYTYFNSPDTTHNGNCTWWCYGRLLDTTGTHLENYMIGETHDAKYWYTYYTGNKSTNANSIKAGDIIVLSDSAEGHVMFVEQVSGNTVHISQSAYSTRSLWDGYACRVTSYDKSDIYAGNSLDMYKDISISPAYETVVGIIHTGKDDPTPPTPSTEDLEIVINPPAYSVTMQSEDDFVDFTFAIAISGIPAGQTVSGGNSYPGLSRVYNSGWSYTSYVIDGITYQRANKTQTLRYYRESNAAYTTTKHMYFQMSYSTGTINTDTPMYINVRARTPLRAIIGRMANRRRRGHIEII